MAGARLVESHQHPEGLTPCPPFPLQVRDRLLTKGQACDRFFFLQITDPASFEPKTLLEINQSPPEYEAFFEGVLRGEEHHGFKLEGGARPFLVDMGSRPESMPGWVPLLAGSRGSMPDDVQRAIEQARDAADGKEFYREVCMQYLPSRPSAVAAHSSHLGRALA